MRDLYQEITDRIVAAIELGTPPWVRPWSAGNQSPRNAATGYQYRGINTLLLSLQAALQGYPRHEWLTYRQALMLGGQVRGGEHGTVIRKTDPRGWFGWYVTSRPPAWASWRTRYRPRPVP